MRFEPKLSFVALAILALSGCASLSPTEPLRVVGHKSVDHGAMSDAEAQYALGKYYLGQNRAALALLAFTRAVEADPKHVEAYNARATAFVHLGDLERAESDLARAINLAPQAAHLRNNQGYLRILRENYEGAAESLRTAFELEPRNERVVANWKLLSARVSTNPVLAKALRASPIEQQAGMAPARAPEPTEPVVAALSEVLSGPVINLPAPRASTAAPLAASTSAPAADSIAPHRASTRIVDLTPPSADAGRAKAQERVTVAAPAVPTVAISAAPTRVLHVSKDGQVSAQQPVANTVKGGAVEVIRTSSEPKPVVPATATTDARIEVSNGNGIRGMAARFSKQLARSDYKVVRISNAQRFDYQQTRIYFRTGYLEQALELSRSLPVRTAVMLNNDVGARSDLLLIVGRDLATGKVVDTKESTALRVASHFDETVAVVR